jgi:hypothetical protein
MAVASPWAMSWSRSDECVDEGRRLLLPLRTRPYLVVCHRHSLGNPYTYTRTREHVHVNGFTGPGPGVSLIPWPGNGLCPGDSLEPVR